MVTPDARRGVVSHLRERWKFSERKACRIARISHTVIRYQKRPDRNARLRTRLRQLAAKYPRFGSPMVSGAPGAWFCVARFNATVSSD